MIFIIYFYDANYDSINKQQGVIAEIFCRVGCGGDIEECYIFVFFSCVTGIFFQKMFFFSFPATSKSNSYDVIASFFFLSFRAQK